MIKFSRFLTLLLATLLPVSTCSAELSFRLNQFFTFTKTNNIIEHLDHDKFVFTACTTDWTSSRDFTTYILEPEFIWVNKSKTWYAKASGNYGWVISGKVKTYPIVWNVDGNTKGFYIETGYIKNMYDRFDLIPFIGYQYDVYDTKIKHQHFNHETPDSFVSQNGNKNRTTLWFPYIGIEIDFKSRLLTCVDIQYAISYQIGYGGGHGRNKVPFFFVTDNPATSRYGNHIKFRDMINHDFEIAAFYAVTKSWQIGLEFDYNITYNTHRLPVKLQRNREVVKSGQFTPTQYHRMNDYVAQNYSLILGVIYNFGGESTILK